jgi:tRNA-2-methylthio-N6-dimethylallyladenosine synthase
VKRVYVETYGCQMNVADSALIEHVLREAGYSPTDDLAQASLILLNTCAVRERAEERVVRRLESLAGLKKLHPGIILGVAGCMPKHLGEDLLRRLPQVDLLVGPDSYRRLPELVEAAAGRRTSDLRLDAGEDYSGCDPVAVDGVSAFVPVMRGCDRFCTFCVVPLARGREKSLPLPEILRQVQSAIDRGAREVTLLGQTVNSYHHGEDSFTSLLAAVSGLEESVRFRFTSPHPADFREEHFRLMAERRNLSPHLHLPVQSGSDRILAAMKRGYTRSGYLELVRLLRSHLPQAGLTTDLLTGFPGEDEADFQDTLSLMREVEFDNAFLFRYSERAGTYAARHQADDVPSDTKGRRLEEMIRLQEEISLRRYRRFEGREVEVLVEGVSRRRPEHAAGKTPDFKRVVLPAGPPPGTLCRVRIARATSHSLLAEGVGEVPAEEVAEAAETAESG